MEYKATLRYLHMTPRKVRLLADLIRGKNAAQARQELRFTVKRAAGPLGKLLDSAIANARQQGGEGAQMLRIKAIRVDQGPKRRTFLPRAFGRVSPIDKRMSHVTLVLESATHSLASEPAAAAASASASEHPFGVLPDPSKAPRVRNGARRTEVQERKSVRKGAPSAGRRIFRRKSI